MKKKENKISMLSTVHFVYAEENLYAPFSVEKSIAFESNKLI